MFDFFEYMSLQLWMFYLLLVLSTKSFKVDFCCFFSIQWEVNIKRVCICSAIFAMRLIIEDRIYTISVRFNLVYLIERIYFFFHIFDTHISLPIEQICFLFLSLNNTAHSCVILLFFFHELVYRFMHIMFTESLIKDRKAKEKIKSKYEHSTNEYAF